MLLEVANLGFKIEEMIKKLRDLGANTPIEVPYIEEEMLAKVKKGKQRDHILGRGRQVASVGKTKVFGSQPRGWLRHCFQPQIDHMLAQRDQQLVEAKADAKAYQRELD
ncbi:hypothetical protein Tco_0772228 [Tanacetum coccineum]|uniref:Uncharacterized protein n=1 Tax=Tanacetum coccineum TaxID=301880 RepID=A0ABQ4ZKY2_9ASTR